MKKIYALFLLSLISSTALAQASFTATGIAVQGIARDANNSAYKNQNITLDFEFFSKSDAGAINDPFSAVTRQVVTDNFGVFSTVIDPTSANNAVFSNQKVWLRITNKEDSRIIQESQLMHVPYAISANNGVPTGTIMPFMGGEENVPDGWLLCDGRSMPDGALKDMLQSQNLEGSKTPDLRGLFLRGTGNQGGDNHFIGPNLAEIQLDGIKTHIPTLTDGEHAHPITDKEHSHNIAVAASTADGGVPERGTTNHGWGQRTDVSLTGITGTNSASSNISVKYNGATETRPINYGVNYIIKL
jgi:hypothetical protein